MDASTKFIDSVRTVRNWNYEFDVSERLEKERSAALNRVKSLPMPNSNEEDWRFTDLSELCKLQLPPVSQRSSIETTKVDKFSNVPSEARIVLIDGRYDMSLSKPFATGENLVGTMRDMDKQDKINLQRRLGNICNSEEDFFSTLNVAYHNDVAVVIVRSGQKVDRPIHIVSLSTQDNVSVHPRVLVAVEKNATAIVYEQSLGLDVKDNLINSVVEFSVESNARVDYVKLIDDSKKSYVISNTSVRVDRDGVFRSWSFALGGRLSRHNLNVSQEGEGAEMQVSGLAITEGSQVADTHSRMAHLVPNGRSKQIHKTVVLDRSHAVFNGKIDVASGAQLTNSSQESRNLLLGKRARVDAKPELEILADDVKCAHGATVGQLEDEQIFYLRSRGLSNGQVRNMLTYAFAAEVVETIPVDFVRENLKKRIEGKTIENGI